jgi:hypothetical protein
MIPTAAASSGTLDLIPVFLFIGVMGTGIVGWVLNRAEKLWFAVGVWVVTLGLIGAIVLYSAVQMGWIVL